MLYANILFNDIQPCDLLKLDGAGLSLRHSLLDCNTNISPLGFSILRTLRFKLFYCSPWSLYRSLQFSSTYSRVFLGSFVGGCAGFFLYTKVIWMHDVFPPLLSASCSSIMANVNVISELTLTALTLGAFGKRCSPYTLYLSFDMKTACIQEDEPQASLRLSSSKISKLFRHKGEAGARYALMEMGKLARHAFAKPPSQRCSIFIV